MSDKKHEDEPRALLSKRSGNTTEQMASRRQDFEQRRQRESRQKHSKSVKAWYAAVRTESGETIKTKAAKNFCLLMLQHYMVGA